MSNNIISRDGNLVEVDFGKNGRNNAGKKVAGAAMSGVAMGAIIPVLAIGGATPFLNPESNDKQDGGKATESRLPENPAHFSSTPEQLIKGHGEKKPWDGSYVGQLSRTDGGPVKTR